MSATLVYKCDGCGRQLDIHPQVSGSLWNEELRLIEGASDFHACDYTCFMTVLDKFKEKVREALSRVRIT